MRLRLSLVIASFNESGRLSDIVDDRTQHNELTVRRDVDLPSLHRSLLLASSFALLLVAKQALHYLLRKKVCVSGLSELDGLEAGSLGTNESSVSYHSSASQRDTEPVLRSVALGPWRC